MLISVLRFQNIQNNGHISLRHNSCQSVNILGIARKAKVVAVFLEGKSRMRVTENQCVDCGLPCLGNFCRYRNVVVDYCDECGEENAKYRIDGKDYCEDCAEAIIDEEWSNLSLTEKANAVNIDLSEICD